MTNQQKRIIRLIMAERGALPKWSRIETWHFLLMKQLGHLSQALLESSNLRYEEQVYRLAAIAIAVLEELTDE